VVTVEYAHEIAYAFDSNGTQYPRLTLRLMNPSDAGHAVDVDAYLDSGAERSLFNGILAPLLGIADLFAGREISFQSTVGTALTARLHPVRLSHPALGLLDLEVAFSTSHIHRNLLGRDLFSRAQIGFRESRLALYITAQP
jgi:hypothetical protein